MCRLSWCPVFLDTRAKCDFAVVFGSEWDELRLWSKTVQGGHKQNNVNGSDGVKSYALIDSLISDLTHWSTALTATATDRSTVLYYVTSLVRLRRELAGVGNGIPYNRNIFQNEAQAIQKRF